MFECSSLLEDKIKDLYNEVKNIGQIKPNLLMTLDKQCNIH